MIAVKGSVLCNPPLSDSRSTGSRRVVVSQVEIRRPLDRLVVVRRAKGGRKRLENMTHERRAEIARQAAKKRRGKF